MPSTSRVDNIEGDTHGPQLTQAGSGETSALGGPQGNTPPVIGRPEGITSGMGISVGQPQGTTSGLGISVGQPQGTTSGLGINVGRPEGTTSGLGDALGYLQGLTPGLGYTHRDTSGMNAGLGHSQERASSVITAAGGRPGPSASVGYPQGHTSSIGNPQGSPPAALPCPLLGDEQGPSMQVGERHGTSLLDALSQSVQQLQDLQAKALTKDADSPTSPENVKPGSASLPNLQPPKDETSSLHFQDWIEISTIVMSDLSDNSARWWSRLLETVDEAYSRYLAATPIERLSIKPLDAGLTTGKWTRVNARACSMLLSAIDEGIKQDLVARRITQDMVHSIFRLYIAYQPGGSAEKGHVLKQLQNPPLPGSIQDCLAVLRSWPRWVRRCRQVGMVTPDPTVLAASLTRISAPFILQSPDAGFRTQLLRTTLRLEASPTAEAVESYHSHLLAEIEMIVSSTTVGKAKPMLQAVEGQSSTSPTSSPSRGAKGEALCKYFVKSSGCRRGPKCPFSHDMSQMPKDPKSRKCLTCGSEEHRKRECPVNDSGAKGTGKRDEGSTKGKTSTGSASTSSAPQPQPVVAAQTVDPSELLARTSLEDVKADSATAPMSIESLIKIAQQIVQGQGSQASTAQALPDSTSALRVMTVVNPLRNSLGNVIEATALVDSGATHPLRRASSSDEWRRSRAVAVNLAGNRAVEMKMTDSGTLLLPESDTGSTTIVPVGDLVQTLGYRLDWNRKQCRLIAPDGKALRLSMRDGCPQLPEYQALSLISRLEERKLDQLKQATMQTQEVVRAAALSMKKSWFQHVVEHCHESSVQAGNRAVDAAPFLEGLPWETKTGLTVDHSAINGWELLKEFTCWSRSYRRRLHQSNSWIIHLYSGKCPKEEFKELCSGSSVVLEIDIQSSSQLNVENEQLWRLLSWACANGKVSAILGGPPCRTLSRLRHRTPGPPPVRTRKYPYGWDTQSAKDRAEVIKDTRLFIRMIWLHTLAVAGRIAHPFPGREGDPSVAFVLEQPADPQSYLNKNDPAYAEVASFWATKLWQVYAQEAGLMKISFHQGAMGHIAPKPTSLGTNLTELLSLEGMKESSPLDPYIAPGMCRAISLALRRWLARPRVTALTKEQWAKRVESGHQPYEKTCEVCVTSSGTGKRCQLT